MENKKIVDMTYAEIMALPPKEKNERLKEYRKYLVRIINKLYSKAIKFPSFSFSKNEEELTLYEMAQELNNFLKSKNMTDKEINDLVYKGVKK